MQWKDPGLQRHGAASPHPYAMALKSGPALLLDANERRICGIAMPPLLSGEYELLAYLGSHPCVWHTTRALSERVYQREDPAALQLVWKYVSTLRKKLAAELPSLLQSCRRRGYCCRAPLRVVCYDGGAFAEGAAALSRRLRP